MERSILCRSPRGRQNRAIPRVITVLSFSILFPVCTTQPVNAMEPPSVVIEDTVTLGVGVKTVDFDTTHFGEPSLLVGTVKNGSGDCFVLRVRTNPLEVAETLYTCQCVPLLVRAGRLDADGFPELLVSLDLYCPNDSPYYSSVVLRGPTFESADTICFRSYLNDAIIDDSSHEVWLAYSFIRTSVDTLEGGFLWTFGGSGTTGFVLHRPDVLNASTQDTVHAYTPALDIARIDVDSNLSLDNVAFWLSRTSSWSSVPHEPHSDGASFGFRVSDDTGDSLFAAIWWYHLYIGSGISEIGLDLFAPTPLFDANDDGLPEALSSTYTRYTDDGGRTSYTVAIRQLVSGDSLWSRELPWSRSYRRPAASLWDFDSDGAEDVLVFHRITPRGTPDDPLATNSVWGLVGTTGDSLFYFESPYPIDPVVVGTLDNSGVRKGVLVRADTLFIFHLDFTPTGIDDQPGVTPTSFTLHQNYPNPFNTQTRIEYEVTEPTRTTLEVFDILGRYVRTLYDGTLSAGRFSVPWDGRNNDGDAVSSGVYFYRMKAEHDEQVRKMLLLK